MKTPLPPELAPLSKLLEKDEPKALVVVGAGISQGATAAPHASWLGLLKHGIDHLIATEVIVAKRGEELKATLEASFSPFDLKAALQHAELIEQILSIPDRTAFAHWLETAFQDLRAQTGREETLEALRDLQQAGALLLTTNYDSVLSEATKLPPVTWEEHAEFLEVINRRRPGILHVHGHWRRPSSVILGKSSYDRIVQDQDFQAAFKSLWLGWSWLYVGCGDGLDDPNLGRLLEWGKRWGTSALPDYFLARTDKALAIARRPDKPGNLVSVGYPDHPRLPGILHSLAPESRSRPFVRIDVDFALFRSPGSSALSVPFPSQQEYLSGEVPALVADAVVLDRLQNHGWAFVLDVASVGKTTLALRMAMAPEQREHPAFYLDLATVDDEDVATRSSVAFRLLLRPNHLLILDNAHHQPELARRLWEEWRDNPRGSKLLLLATHTQRSVSTTPAQDLAFFEQHATNASIEIRPTPEDLGDIMRHLYRRVGGFHAKVVPTPSKKTLEDWHREYGSALGAFCLAVLNRLAELHRSIWDLPLEAASDWVREKWLRPLDSRNHENVICLAVFGAQELEMRIQKEALPHPEKIEQLLQLGLVLKTERGQFGQHHTFSLREPGWGRLIIAAQSSLVDRNRILFETAARSLQLAVTLGARLRHEGLAELLGKLCEHLANTPDGLLKEIFDYPPSYAAALAQMAEHDQPQLAKLVWDTIEDQPERFAACAWETSLSNVGAFLDAAKRNQLNTGRLWAAIESKPERLSARAGETSLGDVATFLETARRHQRDAAALWEALEREPDKFAARAWEAPLSSLTSFFDIARRNQRVTAPLWEAIEREPEKLVGRAFEAPLANLAAFIETAKQQQRDTTPLWDAIEHEPDKLAERAQEATLGNLASFLETATRHQRDITPLWNVIESAPATIAERAWEAPIGHLASFLKISKEHPRIIKPLWEAIEREPDKLTARVWKASLGEMALFFDIVQQHQWNPQPLWEAIEREPDRLAARAWEASLGQVASFLNTAQRHARNTQRLWEAIEREPDRLATRVWEASLGEMASFLDTAQRHARNTRWLWEAIEREPDRLAARLWEASLGQVASFLNTAQRHARNTQQLWEVIEREPDKLAACAWETPLEHLAAFLGTAMRHRRVTAPLWQELASNPSRLIECAWETSLDHLTAFLNAANGRQEITEPLWEEIEREPHRFAARAMEAQLEHLASFLNVAEEQEREVSLLTKELESHPEQFLEKVKTSPTPNLAGFFHHAPEALKQLAIANLDAAQWGRIPASDTMVGATWIASHCAKAGREDLKSALITALIQRKNPNDFPIQGMSFSNVAWLLRNVPPEAISLIPSFLDALCTSKWLGTQYSFAALVSLANGLRMLAFHQPPEISQRFLNPSLGIRAKRELSNFAQAQEGQQSRVIQFLGCAALVRGLSKANWVNNVPLDQVSRLPVDVLGHQADATKVDTWQLQLWLGLRVVATMEGKPLEVPPAIISQTLDLWRANLAESSLTPGSAEHRLHQNMVSWLERCSLDGRGLLLPGA